MNTDGRRGTIRIENGKVVKTEERLDERSSKDTAPRLKPGESNGALGIYQIQRSKDLF